MPEPANTIVLITGASSGIGLACAQYLHAQGYTVYGTSRNPNTDKAPIHWLAMDVTDSASVNAAVAALLAKEGRIDVLVNNAGIGIMGPLEETSVDEARGTLETNFFGVHRVCRAVVPAMRKAGAGKIINISSIAGQMGLPFRGFYSASKAALERYSEVLRLELEEFGIHVSVIDPGSIKTPINENRQVAKEAEAPDSPYREGFARNTAIIHADVETGLPPEAVARQVTAIIRAPQPKMRYVVAHLKQRAAILLSRLLPANAFLNILKKNYRVDR
ncbi:MAG: SDR family oxidoreductase [Bacteroidota bacterium]